MPGFGSELVQPLSPGLLSAQNIVGNDNAPIVSPSAIEALNNAFKTGIVTADDLIQRYGEVAQEKDKAEIQGLHEFISPEAIAARKLGAEHLSAKQRSEMALLPVEEQAKYAQAQSIKVAAEQGDTSAMRKFSIEHGFVPSRVSDGNYTEANRKADEAIYQDAARYEAGQREADNFSKTVQRIPHSLTVEKGGITTVTQDKSKDQLIDKESNAIFTNEQAMKAKAFKNMTPESWRAAGKPTFGQYVFGAEAPTTEGATAEPSTVPVNKLVTPKTTTETTETTPDGGTKTTKKIVESTEHPNAADASIVSPIGENVTSYKESAVKPQLEESKMTANQATIAAFLPDFTNTREVMKNLETKGYDVSGTWPTITGKFPEGWKPEDRKSFLQASDAWIEGALRPVSGAAISASERDKYRSVYFPVWGDTPELIARKAKLRNEKEQVAASIVSAGRVINPTSPEAKHFKAIQDEADRLSGKTSGTTATGGGTQGAPTPVGNPVVSKSTGRKLQLMSDGSYTVIP